MQSWHPPFETKSVFKVKRDVGANIERHKARLVQKEFQQREGIDHTDIFSHVVSKPAIPMFLRIVTSKDKDIQQTGIDKPFINGELGKEIKWSDFEGRVESPCMVYCSNESLYGLKQTPRESNRALS